MSYRYDKQRTSRRRWYIIFTLGLILALFTPLYSWLFGLFEKPLARSWENKQEFFDGSENFIEAFYGKTRLVEKNKELEKEIIRLEIDNLRTAYLSQQLEKISQIKNEDDTLVVARILSFGTFGSSDTVIINQGLDNGITIDDEVFMYENISLGYVSDVYDTTARVTLYSQVEQSINGVLFPHDINLTAYGYGKGSFIIETPREVEVVEGDIFYSLNQPESIIGIVKTVTFDARDPFKKAYITYPVNLNEVQLVGIKKQTPTSIIIE